MRQGMSAGPAEGMAVMTRKSVATSSPETDVAAEARAPHPMDSWLKRELQALYGGPEQAALPPGIAELAAQLEERLRQTASGPGGEGRRREPAGRGRGAVGNRTAKGTPRGGKR